MTAVENVFEQLEQQGLIFLTTKTNEMTITISASDYLDIKRLAKEMEKQQIIDAFELWRTGSGEQYYNETYGSKGSDETKGYPHSHIYETIGGKYGLSSYNEHDQTDGIFNSYQEAVDFGLSLIKPTHTSSQTEISDEAQRIYGEHQIQMLEISDEEIEKYAKQNAFQYYEFITGAKWYREQLKQRQ